MTRHTKVANVRWAAALLMAACTACGGSAAAQPETAKSSVRSVYCGDLRALETTFSESVNHYAQGASLAAEIHAVAERFDRVASLWKTVSHGRSRRIGAVGADLTTWERAIASGDAEARDRAVEELMRDVRTLPACRAAPSVAMTSKGTLVYHRPAQTPASGEMP